MNGSGAAWVLAADTRRLGAMVAAARGLGGRVTVLAVGPRSLAEAAAATGPDSVAWIEAAADAPPEAYAPAVARAVVDAGARVVLAAPTPPDRALLGAAAGALDAAVVAGVLGLSLDGAAVVVERADLGGRVLETLASTAAVAGVFGGPEVTGAARAGGAPVESLAAEPADVRIERAESVAGADSGLATAERVVAVGRGLKAQPDLALVERLAKTLGAAVGCSMPIADDYGWIPKDCYIGRSGQHIAPRLYLAIGISGAPQHLDGVRDAKVVIAVNNDPDAPIFRRADYGIVGDLYDVIPELEAAVAEIRSPADGRGEAHE